MTAAAIIVAAGMGQRFGDSGKSFAAVLGKPMAWWSLLAASSADSIDEIVLVCGQHSHQNAIELVGELDFDKRIVVVLGGIRRQDSARAGIDAVSPAVDIVAIHDAARPLVTSELFDAAVASARMFGAAVAAVPVSDTIKRVSHGCVIDTIPREDLVSVQTPQAFQTSLLRSAFAESDRTGQSVTDEASLIETIGASVHIIHGNPENMKVTYPADLALAEALLRARNR